MRIGIIGATGFIGSALARRLVEHGHEIVAYSRKKSLSLAWAKEVRAVTQDKPIVDPQGLDALVNLAGESIIGPWTTAKKRRLRESRVDLTERVVEALRDCPAEARPKVLVNASGVGFYGDRGNEPLTESSVSGGSFLANICTGWESAAHRAEALGLRVVLLRTGLVLGNGSGMWPLLRRVFRFGLGGRLGSGNQWMPWIHLDDEVGIIVETLENESYSGPVNLAAPGCVTNVDFTATVAKVLKRPAFLPTPGFALKLLLGDLGRTILESQRALPKAAVERGYTFQFPELSGALQNLIGS